MYLYMYLTGHKGIIKYIETQLDNIIVIILSHLTSIGD